MGKEVTVASERVCGSPLIGLRVDTVRLSEGGVTGLEVMEPEPCARRESREEKGCGFYPHPGYGEEHLQVYLARGLEPSERGGEADERHRYCWPLELIDCGEIEDGKAIIGLLLLWARD